MPSRRDEWHRGRSKDELRYCTLCQRYLSPIAWNEHEHNPEVRRPDADILAYLEDLTSDVVYLGGIKVTGCASILVVEGVEVFRLRDRDKDNGIWIDLDLRGPAGKRIARISHNDPQFLAPGHAFEVEDAFCCVYDQLEGKPLVSVEAISSKSLQILGTFWVEGVEVTLTEAGVSVGGKDVLARTVLGSGTAILFRRNRAEIGFARR